MTEQEKATEINAVLRSFLGQAYENTSEYTKQEIIKRILKTITK